MSSTVTESASLEALMLFAVTSLIFICRLQLLMDNMLVVNDDADNDGREEETLAKEESSIRRAKNVSTPFPWEPVVVDLHLSMAGESGHTDTCTLERQISLDDETSTKDGEEVEDENKTELTHKQQDQLEFIASMTFAGGLRQPNCPCCV
mmetsp:Transcript_4128/g.9369  ORF Transcript_4128/g.9369 Transcript_4128/m.9369 type:complete len:150 (+) Transcript_4128:348-797(+)|eukprot:CAMPEP_0178498308 /NCGR_PEP_ID=MMETSP0696-20121128/15183_1 /TAXON_ID=265572 /ORGANISM="Extubocellulus spinifer, Strain CCMP396" /LENGTH=149 /DNA_ID=CAMNT_0020126853 /DNA_START=263 /DNA_END=712 /DNA_ORIENTATION=-